MLNALLGLQALMPYPIDEMRTWTYKTFPKEDFRYWSFNRLEGEGEVGALILWRTNCISVVFAHMLDASMLGTLASDIVL